MKAKCPKCLDAPCKECEYCKGTGSMSISWAKGDMFTRLCLSEECQFVNGGTICDGFPTASSGKCFICDGETEWVSVNDPKLEDLIHPPPWHKNQYEHNCRKLQKDKEYLLERMDQIRDLAKSLTGWRDVSLTIEQAQLMKVCRICKEPDRPKLVNNKPDHFVTNYGTEYAHRSCLDKTGLSV